MNGHLSLLGAEHLSLYPYDIAHVKLFEIRIGLLAHTVSCHIALNVSGKILYVAKGCLSHDALCHKASRNGDLRTFEFIKMIFNLLAVMGHLIVGDMERIPARLLQSGKLFPSYLQ